MRPTLRIIGLLYLLYGLVHVLQIPRLLALYQDFGAEIPIYNIVLIPLGIFIWSILLFVASSSQKFTNRVRMILLFISIVVPVIFYIVALILPIYNLTSQY